jgi:acetyl-CoA C-acetyltransferase
MTQRSHAPPVFVLGGYQTDFARNYTREGKDIADLVRDTALGALAATGVAPAEVEVGHVGNFAAELFVGQGHLGGLLVEADRAFRGLPTSRHEAACASGSVAMLAAMADLQAGRYDTT